jgi:hypothetical protein
MCRRWGELWECSLDEDDPYIAGFGAVRVDLAHRILLFEVRTRAALGEKKRIIKLENIEVGSNHMIWSIGSDFISFIYKLDAERIAAAA